MASYYIGLYIVRRYYAEKQQQQQQQNRIILNGGWSCHSKDLTMMLFGINGQA